ncbi:MAG: hypothetical protein WAK95_08190 [Desulfobacterales bacterium]
MSSQFFPDSWSAEVRLAGTLFGGEQAMISIGRGMMSTPRLLIIDEPPLGLAPTLVNENFKVIRTLKRY